MSKSSGWINNFARIWAKKANPKQFFFSLPLSEPVTLKLQRRGQDGDFYNQEVTLVPEENDKGYRSVMLPLKKVEPYQHNGETIKPPENLRFELSVPPPRESDESSEF